MHFLAGLRLVGVATAPYFGWTKSRVTAAAVMDTTQPLGSLDASRHARVERKPWRVIVSTDAATSLCGWHTIWQPSQCSAFQH